MIDAKTGIQYEIMTEDCKDENGNYVPHLDALIEEAPNDEVIAQWERVKDLIGKTKDSDFPFGFAFRFVCCVEQKCGHYEILQNPYNEQYDSVEDILTEFDEENRKCTKCICNFK